MAAKRKPEPSCPQADQHTPDQPDGYQAWHAWAEEMGAKGYRQKLCPGCQFYKIWTKPPDAPDAHGGTGGAEDA